MRWLPVLLAFVACAADTGSDGSRCELGPSLHDDAVAKLVAESPDCTRDDECVLLSTSLHCDGFVLGDCGTPVHRDVVDDWDAPGVCREIEKLPAQRGVVCDSSPSCVRAEPACIDRRCKSR